MSGQGDSPDKLQQQIRQSQDLYDQEEYKTLVQKHSPKPTILKNTINAFLVGGDLRPFPGGFNLFPVLAWWKGRARQL